MVSIAMATYNAGKDGGKYLRMQLDSILAQTIQEYEVVVCDDNSLDGTVDILKEYAERDSRFRIYENEVNLGIVKNFERAITLCEGEYIALSDQDDVWLPDHIETLIGAIGDKMLVCGNMLLIDANGELISEYPCSYLQSIDWLPEDDIDKAYSIIYFFNCFLGQSILFRKELVKYILPIPSDIHFHDFWFSLSACFHGGLNFTDKIVTKYRRYTDNHSWTPMERQNRLGCLRAHFKGKFFSDRRPYLNALNPKTEEETEFVRMVNRYIANVSCRGGRFRNLIFEIKNFRRIYRSKHNFLVQSLMEIKDWMVAKL